MVKKAALVEHLHRYILQHSLIQKGDLVLVAVSGGADSMALFHACLALRLELSFKMMVVHLNHNLRKSSSRDQQFVKSVCSEHNISFRTKTLAKLKNKPASIEDYARQKRLLFFKDVLDKTGAKGVLLAHHQDDVAETMLLQLITGAGLAGLRGMLPKRDVNGVCLLRPMLNVSRKQIDEYIKSEQIEFCQDETNQDLDIKRNRVRHELIPYINKKFNTHVQEILARNALLIADDYDVILNEAQNQFDHVCQSSSNKKIIYKVKLLKKMPLSLRRQVFRLGVDRLTGGERGRFWSECTWMALEQSLQSSKVGFRRDLGQNIVAQQLTSDLFALFLAD